MSGPWGQYQKAPAAEAADGPWTQYALGGPGPFKPESAAPVENTVARQVGLLARHGIEGLGQLAEIGTEPIRAGLEALGAPKMQPTGRAATALADTIGLPAPQNAIERVVADATRLGAGAGGMAGLARKAGGAVASALGGNVGAQAIGSTGAGVAGGSVREGGGDPLEQGIAAFAGGVLAPSAAARVALPKTSAQVRALMAEGVTPTPGQMAGGVANAIEEKSMSIPVVGDAIRAGRERAVGELNRAAIQRALAPIGEKLPKGVEGREAIGAAQKLLGAKYDSLLTGITVQADNTWLGQVGNVRQMMRNGSVSPEAAAQFDTILKNQVLGKFQGQNAVTGETMKAIESDLGNLASRFASDPSSDRRLVGDALFEVQSQLRKLVGRSNPAIAADLAKVNHGYANFKRVQRAAAALGSDEGSFTPAQLLSAVKATDRSKDKGRFARGDALMQDLADAGRTVLGSKVPDSGTAGRLLGAGALGYGAAMSPATIGGLLAPSLLYTPAGQRAFAALMSQRPQALRDMAQGGELLPLSSLLATTPLVATQ